MSACRSSSAGRAQGKGALYSFSGINTYSGTVTLQDDPLYPNDDDDPPFNGAPDLDDEAAIGVAADPNPTAGPAYFTSDYSLTITGALVSKAVVATVINNNSGNTSNAIVTPAIELIKSLGGQLILPNDNSNFQGSVDIQGGWITVENSNSLGGHILGLGDTQQPTIKVESGAALQLDAPGNSINIGQNLNLTGTGFVHSYGLINQMGAIENIAGNNTLSGNVALNGPVGIGVEDIFGASDLTMTGTLGSQTAKNAIAVNGAASGGSAENDNVDRHRLELRHGHRQLQHVLRPGLAGYLLRRLQSGEPERRHRHRQHRRPGFGYRDADRELCPHRPVQLHRYHHRHGPGRRAFRERSGPTRRP